MIGVNTLTQVDQLAYVNHCQFWYRLGKNHPDIEFALSCPRRASIDRMRNQTAQATLENNFDYLMFVDDDVLVPVDGLKKLLEADADIAAGHTVIRGYPYNNMFFKYEEDKTLTYDNEPVLNERGLIECAAVGFSFVLIKTSLIKKVPPPYFVTGTHNTEDVYFCLKAKEYNPETTIVVDPAVRTGHILGSEVVEPDNKEALKKFFEDQYPQLLKKKHPEKDDRGNGYLGLVKETLSEVS